MTAQPSMIASLPDRGVIAVSGEDRKSFLQGLITNEIGRLDPATPLYAALLTAQGKYLHDFFLVEDGDRILFDVEADRRADLLRRLTLYRLRARVTLDDLSEDMAVTAIWNVAAPPAFPEALVYADPRLPGLGFRVLAARATAPVPTTDAHAYDLHRLSLGVPDGARDLEVERTLILEGNLDALNGVSFEKGCYVGQELTARMKYRGKVRKRVLPVTVAGALPEPGTPITDGAREIGTLRSGRGTRALALLRVEDITFGTPYACGEATVTPLRPDWLPGDVLPAAGDATP